MIFLMLSIKASQNRLFMSRKLKSLKQEEANPLLEQVRKLLADTNQGLILMVKG